MTNKIMYPLRVTKQTQAGVVKLAADLGYIITERGANFGKSSLPSLLADLAELYAKNPDQVLDAFRDLGLGKDAGV